MSEALIVYICLMRTVFILCLFLLSGRSFAQSQTEQKVSEDVYRNLEEKAKPDYNWLQYLSQNLLYPEAALKNEIRGIVDVEFIVEKDGSITHSRIVRGKEIGYGIPEEALRLINNAPKWKPGRQKNQPVRSYYTTKVHFFLPQDVRLSDLPSNSSAPIINEPKESAVKIDENYIYRTVQVKPKPTFNEGEFFSKNLVYPEQARDNEIQGRVIVEFTVEKDGSITNVKVVRGKELAHGIPEEAIRIVKAMPRWTPAMMDGKMVRAYHVMPVSFNL